MGYYIMEKHEHKTAIIGFGNVWMTDDGIGIEVIRRLAQIMLPDVVEVIDGGVSFLTVLAAAKNAGRLIIIDAVNGPGPAGTIYRLKAEDLIPKEEASPLSLHDFSLAEALHCMAREQSWPPTVIYGVEPADTAPGLELTPQAAEAAGRLVSILTEELLTAR